MGVAGIGGWGTSWQPAEWSGMVWTGDWFMLPGASMVLVALSWLRRKNEVRAGVIPEACCSEGFTGAQRKNFGQQTVLSPLPSSSADSITH